MFRGCGYNSLRLLELQKHSVFTGLFVLCSLVVLFICVAVALIWTIPCVVFALF